MKRVLLASAALIVSLGVNPKAGAAPQKGKAAERQKAKASPTKKGRPAGTRLASAKAAPALPPLRLDLLSFDLAASVAHVELAGVTRVPQARFFTITDERKRRFVPPMVECQPPPAPPASAGAAAADQGHAEGRFRCVLTIPRIYQRAALVGISLEVRGHTLSVAGDRVQAAWTEARARTPLPKIVERPGVPGTLWGRTPDGGPTLDRDVAEQESESEQE